MNSLFMVGNKCKQYICKTKNNVFKSFDLIDFVLAFFVGVDF